MKRARIIIFTVISTVLIMARAAWPADTFLGTNAGTGGNNNTFIGEGAGQNNSGSYNAYLGYYAGGHGSTGGTNTYVGTLAGYNAAGNGNVFIGYAAGYSETGSNRLYIDNCYTHNVLSCDRPLIYGEFDNRLVSIDGQLEMGPPPVYLSDGRFKEDIEPLKSSLEKITRLRGVTFKWKAEKEGYEKGFGGKKQIGVIAQEVEKVFPELVYTDAKGVKSVAYENLGPIMIEAIKELKQINEKQEAVIKEKDERIVKLEKESARLSKAIEELSVRIAAMENQNKYIAEK